MRVLYVDDEESNRSLIGSMLKRLGVAMDEAPDADTGLWMFASQDYDLVLMDIRMPGKDGFAAIGEIRAHTDARREVPIVVLTADDAHEIRVRARALGAQETLMKPVSKDQLAQAIARVAPGWSVPKAA